MHKVSGMRKIILFSLLIVSFQSASAQTGELWLSGKIGLATEKFAEDVGTPWGAGFDVGYVHSLSKNSNIFQLGGALGYLYMGKDKTNIVEIPVKTTNDLLLLHLVARLRPQSSGNIHPYVDIMLGGKIFSTTTKYDNSALETLLNVEDKTIFNEQVVGAWSYGSAIGFSGRKSVVGFDFKLSYLKGTGSRYTSPRDFVVNDDGTYFYESTRVRNTDMVFVDFGFSVYFN